MRASKVVALVAGILMVLIAVGLVVPGGFLLGIYGTQRDSDGFFHTSSRVLSTNGSALVTPDVELNVGPIAGHWLSNRGRAAIRIEAAAVSDERLFLGIGPSSSVARYLEGVDYDEVTDFGWPWSSVRYRHMDGATPALPPGEQDFWVIEEEGSGAVTIDWDIAEGNWTAVVMNADGSAPVRTEVSLGARLGIVLPVGIGLTVGGVILLGVGVFLIVVGARKSPAPPAPVAPAAASQPSAPQTFVSQPTTPQNAASQPTTPEATPPQATTPEQPGSKPSEPPSSES